MVPLQAWRGRARCTLHLPITHSPTQTAFAQSTSPRANGLQVRMYLGRRGKPSVMVSITRNRRQHLQCGRSGPVLPFLASSHRALAPAISTKQTPFRTLARFAARTTFLLHACGFHVTRSASLRFSIQGALLRRISSRSRRRHQREHSSCDHTMRDAFSVDRDSVRYVTSRPLNHLRCVIDLNVMRNLERKDVHAIEAGRVFEQVRDRGKGSGRPEVSMSKSGIRVARAKRIT